MVRVVGRSEEEKALYRKYKTLVEITLEEGERVVEKLEPGCFAIGSYSNGIVVHLRSNKLDVGSRGDLDKALEFAKLYEKETGEEFTVKKNYED